MKRVWVTKDGQHLKIRDMETSHIKNCIRFLERYHDAKAYEVAALPCFFIGEQAQFHAEQAWDDYVENGFEDEAQEFIDSFKDELSRREEPSDAEEG